MTIKLIKKNGEEVPYTMQDDNKLDLYSIYSTICGQSTPDYEVLDPQNFCKLRFAATLAPSDAQATYTDEAQVYLHYCDSGTESHIQLSASDIDTYNANYNTAISGSESSNVYFTEAIR